MKSGIYEIHNSVTGRSYVGSASDLESRFIHHMYVLERNRHCNPHLQRSWNRHGSKSFTFITLEYCPPESLIEREQFYIDARIGKGNLYNVRLDASSQYGLKHSNATKEKISLSLLGNKRGAGNQTFKGHVHSTEAKNKISIANKGNKYCVGRKYTNETRNKLSLAQTGKTASVEAKERMSNSHKGFRHTDESKKKIAGALMGVKKTKEHCEKMKLAWERRRIKNA